MVKKYWAHSRSLKELVELAPETFFLKKEVEMKKCSIFMYGYHQCEFGRERWFKELP